MPLFLLSILGGAKTAFGAVLSFCSKPPGSWIAAALAACLGLWWFGHLKYAAGVAAAVAAASARSAQLKAKQDKAIAGVTERETARAVESSKKDAATQEAVSNVKESAASKPDAGSVVIAADIADELRSVR